MLVTYLRSSFWRFTNATQKSEPHLSSIAQSKIKLAWLLYFIPCYWGWQFFDEQNRARRQGWYTFL